MVTQPEIKRWGRIGRVALPAGEVHVWLAEANGSYSLRRLARFAEILDDDERGRLGRFAFERDRRVFLIGHALVRGALSAYVGGVRPEAWRFEHNEFGRPEVAWEGGRPIRFNLSGTAGLVACAVTDEADVGVDVEAVDRIADPMEVARVALSAAEVGELDALPPAARRGRFFEMWTLKEAWLKGVGVGLGGAGAGRVDVSRAGAGGEWQCRTSRPTDGHVMSVAVRRRCSDEFRIVERWGVPLAVGV